MTARFTLSLDTEIAWGTFYWGGMDYYRRHFENYRPLVGRFIDLMETYEIAATWVFVGHLFLESCDGRHDDVLRPFYPWYGKDWHHLDPGTDVGRDPFWYAPDVLERVMSMRTKQEIGTHTFSHPILDDPACTPDIARSQIAKCIALGREKGLEIETLVFPRDRVAHLEEFAPLGIRTFRGARETWYNRMSGLASRVAHMADAVAGIPPPVYRLEDLKVAHGMLNYPSSNFLLAFDRYHRFVPAAARWHKARRGIDRAVAGDATYHLAFHPFHLGSSEEMFTVIERIFAYVAGLRDGGRLEVATMRDVHRAHAAFTEELSSARGQG